MLDPEFVRLVWSNGILRLWGLQFAASTLFILLCHELGHWWVCRRACLPTTPPYFIPVPFGLGTLGAFIRIRASIRSRRELLAVGVSGPIAGFLALLPFLFYGVFRSSAGPAPDDLEAAPAGSMLFGSNLLLTGAIRLVHGGLAESVTLEPHPFLLAAWVGMFATMLNLLPLAQLDGGHVLYAAVGRWQRRLAPALWGALAALGFLWSGWWLWCVVTLLLGLGHPPVTDESLPLGTWDRVLIAVAALLFLLCFMPVPLRIVLGSGA